MTVRQKTTITLAKGAQAFNIDLVGYNWLDIRDIVNHLGLVIKACFMGPNGYGWLSTTKRNKVAFPIHQFDLMAIEASSTIMDGQFISFDVVLY